MVLHGFGENLYYGLISTITFHLVDMSKSLEDTQDDSSFLEELHKKWMDHSNAMQIICDIFMYMDRTFVPSTHKSPVPQLGLTLWRDKSLKISYGPSL
ncbi:ubiquitin-protein ligase [Lithospermum erythrorhizon]|uniref:Ubiquitin-protein ligase n=1 Tax=Lithospermum erythrorhizon TaxID=34254 RepID=A0AAV3RCM4_LITER